jgi:hypothetical protein
LRAAPALPLAGVPRPNPEGQRKLMPEGAGEPRRLAGHALCHFAADSVEIAGGETGGAEGFV